jgi:hypothetical protein
MRRIGCANAAIFLNCNCDVLQPLDELVQFAEKEVLVYEGFHHGDEPGMRYFRPWKLNKPQ